MKKRLSNLIVILLMIALSAYSQTMQQFSAGLSIPDNISGKYLKAGLYFDYGVDFKLRGKLYLNSNVSVSYNDASPNYRYGIDEDLYLLSHPEIKREVEESPRFNDVDPDFYNLYLFNPALSINIKYLALSWKKFSVYIGGGFSGNFSFYRNSYDVFTPDETGHIAEIYTTGTEGEGEFNLGLQGICGVNYNFNNGKSIFIETIYKSLPQQKFGINYEKTGLFLVHFGINFPFNRK